MSLCKDIHFFKNKASAINTIFIFTCIFSGSTTTKMNSPLQQPQAMTMVNLTFGKDSSPILQILQHVSTADSNFFVNPNGLTLTPEQFNALLIQLNGIQMYLNKKNSHDADAIYFEPNFDKNEYLINQSFLPSKAQPNCQRMQAKKPKPNATATDLAG